MPGMRGCRAISFVRSLSSRLFPRDIVVDNAGEHCHRRAASKDDGVIESPNIEALAERFFRFLAKPDDC